MCLETVDRSATVIAAGTLARSVSRRSNHRANRATPANMIPGTFGWNLVRAAPVVNFDEKILHSKDTGFQRFSAGQSVHLLQDVGSDLLPLDPLLPVRKVTCYNFTPKEK